MAFNSSERYIVYQSRVSKNEMGYLERQYVPHSREILGLPAIADLVVITLDRSQKAEKRFGSIHSAHQYLILLSFLEDGNSWLPFSPVGQYDYFQLLDPAYNIHHYETSRISLPCQCNLDSAGLDRVSINLTPRGIIMSRDFLSSCSRHITRKNT